MLQFVGISKPLKKYKVTHMKNQWYPYGKRLSTWRRIIAFFGALVLKMRFWKKKDKSIYTLRYPTLSEKRRRMRDFSDYNW
jgi:hypothetical protein